MKKGLWLFTYNKSDVWRYNQHEYEQWAVKKRFYAFYKEWYFTRICKIFYNETAINGEWRIEFEYSPKIKKLCNPQSPESFDGSKIKNYYLDEFTQWQR